ncbi:hypothetical protein INR49_010929 [Caranx melampygus]|nr:hypothetical protein INR49_010929 [Caranx melampygus]
MRIFTAQVLRTTTNNKTVPSALLLGLLPANDGAAAEKVLPPAGLSAENTNTSTSIRQKKDNTTAFRRNYSNTYRVKMLTRWLTVTALLAASANPQTAATSQRVVTVAPTCRVKGHPEEELTLKCGDGKSAGVVQYWHTPFGDLQTPGLHGKMDPVFMHHDGSLVVPNSSVLHSGLYYCLLQHTEETTLWSYKLHIGVNNHKNQKDGKDEQTRSCDSVRFRRDVGPEGTASISDGQFAGVVAASVLLTFVLGFSAGALTRAHVLRCLGAVTKRVQSPLQRLRKSDTPDHSSGVTMTTLPPMSDNEAFEVGQVQDDITMETTVSSTASSPPAKPQRSFRHKREEPQETTAYLEGCDYMKEEERQLEEEEDGGRKLVEKSEGGEGEVEGEVEVEEEREFSGFYLVGEGGGSPTETDEEKYSEDGEEKDGRESREQREEEAGEEGSGSREGGEERSEDEAGGSEEQVRDEREEEGREEETEGDDGNNGEKEEDDSSQQSVTETEEEETGAEKQEDKNDMKEGGGEAGICPPRPARRSRVIRLYQYDEDGQRYCHLPDPAPEDPAPPPRLKQRSLSLTRLSAIMAAASAGPLDKERKEERTEWRGHTSTWRSNRNTEVTVLSAAVRYDSLYADTRPRLTLAGSGCQLTWISVELELVMVAGGLEVTAQENRATDPSVIIIGTGCNTNSEIPP